MIERLPKPLHASVRRALRQAWELDDADKAERLLRNLARRLDQEAASPCAALWACYDANHEIGDVLLLAKFNCSQTRSLVRTKPNGTGK